MVYILQSMYGESNCNMETNNLQRIPDYLIDIFNVDIGMGF
jgi:hypothetical protein